MNDSRPNRLFKYHAPTDQALANLATRKVWFAAPISFNDPFDCALHVFRGDVSEDQFTAWQQWLAEHDPLDPAAQRDVIQDGTFTAEAKDVIKRAFQDAFESQRVDLLTNCGVLCLSERYDDLLMWSHYGTGHRGFCIEYDGTATLFKEAQRVRYSKDIPFVDPLAVLKPNARSGYIEAMMLTKAECWGYEKEWRVLSRYPNAAIEYPAAALRGIHVGAAAAAEFREKLRHVAAQLGVPYREMVVDEAGFAVRDQTPRSAA